MKILTIGGATQDVFFKTRQARIIDNRQDPLATRLLAFEYGAKIKMGETLISFGGGANNVAVGLSRLGLKSTALICVGKDEIGKALVKNLKASGARVRRRCESKDHATGLSVIVIGVAKEDHVALLYRGANEELQIEEKDLKGFDWFYVSSLTGVNREKNLRSIGSFLRANKAVKLMYNPGSEDLAGSLNVLKPVLAETNVLSLNKDEALGLADRLENINKLRDYRSVFKTLFELGPKLIVITDGKHGARAYDGQQFYYTRAYPMKKVVDTTGAGDAFGSAFLASLVANPDNIDKALKAGVKNGAYVVRFLGSQKGLGSREKIL